MVDQASPDIDTPEPSNGVLASVDKADPAGAVLNDDLLGELARAMHQAATSQYERLNDDLAQRRAKQVEAISAHADAEIENLKAASEADVERDRFLGQGGDREDQARAPAPDRRPPGAARGAARSTGDDQAAAGLRDRGRHRRPSKRGRPVLRSDGARDRPGSDRADRLHDARLPVARRHRGRSRTERRGRIREPRPLGSSPSPLQTQRQRRRLTTRRQPWSSNRRPRKPRPSSRRTAWSKRPRLKSPSKRLPKRPPTDAPERAAALARERPRRQRERVAADGRHGPGRRGRHGREPPPVGSALCRQRRRRER